MDDTEKRELMTRIRSIEKQLVNLRLMLGTHTHSPEGYMVRNFQREEADREKHNELMN
jgi:hypothetical protein